MNYKRSYILSFFITFNFNFRRKMELHFEVLNQSDLDAERAKLTKNIQENIEFS